MSIFLQHTAASCRWGIWKTEETPEELLAMLPHREAYRPAAQAFKSEHRRQEWLAVRVLLYTLLGKEKEIGYHPNGKPYLTDASASIGISHTRGYVAVILGQPDREVGIDIEQYGERVRRVAPRFMRDDEVPSFYQNTDVWSLLLHWSAKETIFKCLNASEVDFRNHIRLFPFPVDEAGVFLAEEYRTPARRHFAIHYHLFPDFVLTFTTGERLRGNFLGI